MSALMSARDVVRATSIGASMVAPAIGISPLMPQWEAIARLRGEMPPMADNDALRWGRAVEQPLCRLFSEDTGIEHQWSNQKNYPRDPARAWQHATVDAFSPSIAKPQAVLEAKTANEIYRSEWEPTGGEMGDELGIPQHYLAQVMWQLDVHQLGLGYVTVNIGSSDRRHYRVPADPQLQDDLREMVYEVWRRFVLGDERLPLDGSEKARHYLAHRYPRNRENLRKANEREIALLAEYAAVRAQLAQSKPLLEERDRLENLLREAVGDADGIESATAKVTWKKNRDGSEVNWEKIARDRFIGLSEEEIRQVIAAETETVQGARVLRFRDYREAA